MQIQIKDTDIPILEQAVGQTTEGQDLLKTINQRFSVGRSNNGNSISFNFDMTDNFIAKLKNQFISRRQSKSLKSVQPL